MRDYSTARYYQLHAEMDWGYMKYFQQDRYSQFTYFYDMHKELIKIANKIDSNRSIWYVLKSQNNAKKEEILRYFSSQPNVWSPDCK